METDGTGYVLISCEDIGCVLKTLESVQAERDGYRAMVQALRRRDGAEEEHF